MTHRRLRLSTILLSRKRHSLFNRSPLHFSGERTMTRLLLATLPTAFFLTAALTSALPPADEKATPWREVLPSAELGPCADQLAAALKKPVEALAGGKLDDDDRERAVKKARGLTLLLAAAAQTTEAPAERRAPLYNAAMQLDRALLKGKFADAKTIVAALPGASGFEKPAFRPLPLVEASLRDDAVAALMMQCRTRSFGGLGVEPPPRDRMHDGLEAMLKLLGDGGDGGQKPDELARFAFRLAVLAEAMRSLPPPRPNAEKDSAKWLQASADMRENSLELAKAAPKANRAALRQAALKVSRSCSDCHKVFRD